MFCFLMICGAVMAQKPVVQVNFEIVEGSPFYERYEDDIDTIVQGGLSLILSGFKDFIGFVDFVESESNLRLEVKLTKKFDSSVMNSHYLLFDFIDGEGDSNTDQWEFLSYTAFKALGNDVQEILEAFSTAWEEYLRGHNEDLATRLFREVPLPIPDSTHYIVDVVENRHEAILPFTKETLKLDPFASRFKVLVVGLGNDGSTTFDQQDTATFSGDVESTSSGVPSRLLGCMRIKLKALPGIRPLNGKVFITKYEHKNHDPDDDDTVLDVFFNGI